MSGRVLLVLAGLVLAGCGGSSDTPSADSPLVGEWVMTAADSQGAGGGHGARIELRADGTYEVSSGCTTVNGDWHSPDDRSVTFDPEATTDLSCPSVLRLDPERASLDHGVLTVRPTDDPTWSGHMMRATPAARP